MHPTASRTPEISCTAGAVHTCTAERVYDVGGVGYAPRGGFSFAGREVDPAADPVLARLACDALHCNDAGLRETHGVWLVDGDPMEGALVALGLKAGHDRECLV